MKLPAVLALLLGTTGVLAQEGSSSARRSYRQLLGSVPDAGDDAASVAVFPEHASRTLPLGTKVPVLVGFRNLRDTAVNVSMVAGSLSQVGGYTQDVGAVGYGLSVPAGAELTLPYAFAANPTLGALPYTLELSVFYQAQGDNYASTAFNATVRMAEPGEGALDVEALSMWLLLAALGAGGWMAFKPEGGKKSGAKAKAKAAPRVETGTKSTADKSEWLEGTAWTKKDKAAKDKAAKDKPAKDKPAAKADKKAKK